MEKIKRQEEAVNMMESELKGERLNKNIYIGLFVWPPRVSTSFVALATIRTLYSL
jgi:hypothetical protein